MTNPSPAPYVSPIAYSERVELLPLVLTSGWASGINAYAVITMLGLLGRYGGLDQVPDSLQNPAVLIIAGGLFLVEFVTDKIPYVDTAWDTISTFIRPSRMSCASIVVPSPQRTKNASFGVAPASAPSRHFCVR